MSQRQITVADITDDLLRISRSLDVAHDELVAASRNAAEAERDYHLAKSKAYLASSGTVGEREAQVTQQVAQLRFESHLAEALKVSALERVRSLRAQLSSCQSLATAIRSEMEMGSRYG